MRKDIIKDNARISWILDQCEILHLGLHNKKGTYIVPVHYGYEETENGNYLLYIHGTRDGEKAHALNNEKNIGFEVDHGNENLIYSPPDVSAFGPSFMSVIGNGMPHEIIDEQAKLKAMRILLHHYVNKIPVALTKESLKDVGMWVIEVKNISGRIHNPTKEWSLALNLPIKERHGKHYKDGKVIFDDSEKLQIKTDTLTHPSYKDNKKV